MSLRRLFVALCLLTFCLFAKGQKVVFSHKAGFYDSPFALQMQNSDSSSNPTLEIHYTTNGNAPTECDNTYISPLLLDSSLYSPANLYKIQCSPDSRWSQPGTVEHIIVVRAALFDSIGNQCSPVATASFIVGPHRSQQLPVVSLCVDSAALFDFDTGIYATGIHFDPTHPYSSGNYLNKGRLWERTVHFDFIPHNTPAFSQDCGLRIHGASQRINPQKGLSLYARAEYGKKKFHYPFWDDSVPRQHKRMTLRPWNASWSGAGIEDWLCQQIAAPLRCDRLASRPVVLFINGEYWGIYFLQEKADEHNVEEYYGIDDSRVDFIAQWDMLESGSLSRWLQLYNWLKNADLTSPKDYLHIATEVNLDALIDYMLMQVFTANVDWPLNNVRFFASPETQWRWIFHDADATFSEWNTPSTIIEYMTTTNPAISSHTSPKANLLFRKLLKNKNFINKTISRATELQTTHFNHSTTSTHLHKIAQAVADEVPHQAARFPSSLSTQRWQFAINEIDARMAENADSLVDALLNFFGMQQNPPTATIVPNPSHGPASIAIKLSATTTSKLTIYDINGCIVYTATISLTPGDNLVPLPQLGSGIYLVHANILQSPLRWIIH